MEEAWDRALEFARLYLERGGRENAGRLSVGLLEVEILQYLGRREEGRARLEGYARRTRDPWYRALSECLLGTQTDGALRERAGEIPENLVTLYTALGFWAEGSGDKEMAVRRYKEALESFMDTRLEFSFARERIKHLRQDSE